MAEGIRVIMNDRPLRSALTGVGHYMRHILLHLHEVDAAVQVDPFLFKYVFRSDSWRQAERKDAAPVASGRTVRRISGSRKPWWLRRVLDLAQGAVFRLVADRLGRYDVYHEPNHIPIRCDLPIVTTIHDLSVLVHPHWHPADRVRWYEREFEAGLRRTQRFIAASEFTKHEMVERCGLPPDAIDVTYQAPRPVFMPKAPDRVRAVLTALHLPIGFFLYVGTLEPRKNVIGLLEAYAALPENLRRRHPLVVAGAWGWKQEALRQKLAERDLSSDVRLLGYVSDENLACLYSACTALVWPTRYEGFGLPPLEAMACGAPVIVSDVASLPEVVGQAGMLLDPQDQTAWTDAMHRMADDDAWREACVLKGRRQAARFSWERCLRQTAACYRRVLDQA